MTEKKKKDGRGGYRPGAGRKPIGDRAGVYIAFRVPEEVRDEIRALIRQRGIPCAVFLIEALQLMKERTAIRRRSNNGRVLTVFSRRPRR